MFARQPLSMKGLALYTGLALLSLCFGESIAIADYTTKISPAEVRTASFDGWGCSLAWWANQFGDSTQADTLADICFTTKTVGWQNTLLPGLGLNIVRYNVGGGGGGASIGGSKEQVSPNMPNFKNIMGYWLDWYNNDPSSQSWDWNRDLNQRKMLFRAKARGVNLVELFSDSPLGGCAKTIALREVTTEETTYKTGTTISLPAIWRR